MEKLGLYKIDPERPTLKKATEGSACFDVSYWPTKLNNPSTVGFQGYIYEAVTGYDDNNKPLKRLIDNVTGSIIIMPNERLFNSYQYHYGYPDRLFRAHTSAKRFFIQDWL